MFLCLSIYLHSYLCIRSPCTYLHIHVCMCKKASDCNICFAGPMGHFSSYHKSLYFFVALRNPPCPHESTDAQRHRSERHKTNMQAAVPTQNKYARTRQHAKQIYKHTVARKTNMPSPAGTQNKYGSTGRSTNKNMQAPDSTKKQICGHLAAHKINMQAHFGTQNKYAMTGWHSKQICLRLLAHETNMEAPGGTQNKYAGTRQHAKQIC